VASSEQTATGAGTAEVARAYFAAVAAKDPDAMVVCWEPGGVDRLVELVAEAPRAAVRWRSRGTFDGTAKFEGVAPTGAELEFEGIDMVEVRDGKIRSLHAYLNGMEMARQMGVMPKAGSLEDRAMLAAVNARTAARDRLRRLRER
jgi:predicted ester cyclase